MFSCFSDSFLIASSTSLIAFSTRSNCWLAFSCVTSWSSTTFSVSVTKAANRSFTFLSVSFKSLSLSSATFFRNAVTSAFSFASSLAAFLAAFSSLLAESELGLSPFEFESASFSPAIKVLLVTDEASPPAGVGVADGTSVLGASVVFSVPAGVVGCATVVAVGVGVTCAAAVVADASDFPANPLSPDEFPPPPDELKPLPVTVWFSVACDTTLSAACTLPFPKNNNDATATLAAPKWNLRIEYFVIFSGCDLFLLNLNLICFLL